MLKNTRNFKNRSNQLMPKCRTNEIVVQTLNNEVLIYDLQNDRAHNLNKTTKIIWEKCDGKTSFEEVLKLLETELHTNLDYKFISIALKELAKANLLETAETFDTYTAISRREMLGRYALPALSLPLIMSLVAPTSAQMASCLGTGQMGCNITPCCPNNTCQAVVNPDGTISNLCVATP